MQASRSLTLAAPGPNVWPRRDREEAGVVRNIYVMIRTTVYLDHDTALALRQLAAVQGRSQAELIRDALARYTRRAARPAPKGIGKIPQR
jgi:hypothetical protein